MKNQEITRRDFVNGSLLASGAVLLNSFAPARMLASALNPGGSLGGTPAGDWDGYGGVGEYRNSHGNPWKVMMAAHQIRDGAYDDPASLAIKDSGEVYDLVVVGGGSAGLGTAYFFQKGKKEGQRCLVLDNHPIFGGEAKQNEFQVNGERIMAPQGPWRMAPAPNVANEDWLKELYRDIKIFQADFNYQPWDPKLKKLEFDRGCDFSHILPPVPSFGYFFDEKSHGVPARWIRDFWGENKDLSPFAPEVRREIQEAVFGGRKPPGIESRARGDLDRWLDSISYKEYLEKHLGFRPDVTRFVEPIVATTLACGPEVVSAYSARGIVGNSGLFPNRVGQTWETYQVQCHSFPGGNTNVLRHMVKFLIPDSIGGEATMADIHNQTVHLEALDRSENSTRIRLNATVVRVEHLGKPENADFVQVTYAKDGELHRLRARTVVTAGGGWVNRRVVRDLPEEKLAAYKEFFHAPIMVVNVAVTNWRFLYKLGLTGGRWFDGFGWFCNLRQQMVIGDYRPKLDPDSPAILTFYIPFNSPGMPGRDQVILGRTKLFSTSFADFERQIKETLSRVFGPSGFDAKKDIAGIILNRWGHALIVPETGFMFGRNGAPAAREVVRRQFGRIGFAHAEFEGGQSFRGAASNARRAANEALAKL